MTTDALLQPQRNLNYNYFTLPELTIWHKRQFLQRAKQVLSAQHQMLTETNDSILHRTLVEESRHLSMVHYPKGDRIDLKNGGQYFYHCHRENYDSTEHGHFHCFLRQTAIPKSIRPTPDIQYNVKNSMTHLIAISMNQLGAPIRLFTVNRWVTDETWYDAMHAPKFTKRFKLELSNNSPWRVIDQWIEGMIHLFSPQIHWLHQKRDEQLQQYAPNSHEDPRHERTSIEELSTLNISLPEQIQWIIDSKPRQS